MHVIVDDNKDRSHVTKNKNTQPDMAGLLSKNCNLFKLDDLSLSSCRNCYMFLKAFQEYHIPCNYRNMLQKGLYRNFCFVGKATAEINMTRSYFILFINFRSFSISNYFSERMNKNVLFDFEVRPFHLVFVFFWYRFPRTKNHSHPLFQTAMAITLSW